MGLGVSGFAVLGVGFWSLGLRVQGLMALGLRV